MPGVVGVASVGAMMISMRPAVVVNEANTFDTPREVFTQKQALCVLQVFGSNATNLVVLSIITKLLTRTNMLTWYFPNFLVCAKRYCKNLHNDTGLILKTIGSIL